MVPVTAIDPPHNLGEIFLTPGFHLSHDWFGAVLPNPIEVVLATSEGHLWFGASAPTQPRCTPATPGDFVEGLWERDVVELFLGEAGSTRYQEFNLSPRGAWWTVALSAYRVRMSTDLMPGVRCFAESDGEGWRAAISIPLKELTIRWSLFDGGTLNITAIQGDPQRFLTATDLGGGDPDFHRADRFEVPQVVRAGQRGGPP